MSTQDSSRRAARLHALFRDTVSGKRPVRSPQEAQLFLEAVRSQSPASKCAEMVSSPPGLDAVRAAVRMDLSASFILTHTLPFLRYLSDPGVKMLVDGQLLRQLLLVVVNPPTFLDALLGLFQAGQLPDDSLHTFAWLALELVSLPPGEPFDAARLADCIAGSDRLAKCADHATRELGYRLQKAVDLRSAPGRGAPGGPGGRHDNDFADFRAVHIYPTPDEFLSTQAPYYQTMHEVASTEAERRVQAHVDNQFRLLREDMLAELREDIQVATGKKKSRRRGALVLSGLVAVAIDVGDEEAARFKRCTLLLQCLQGLQALEKLDGRDARKKFLKDRPDLLRHGAFGVLCRGDEIVGCAFLDRDLDKLVLSPPVVSLQFTDDEGLGRALMALWSPGQCPVQFVLVDTPVFAYEPVLVALQRMADVPLLPLLVDPAGSADARFELPQRLRPFVNMLNNVARELDGCEGGVTLREEQGREVTVDKSQFSALLLALTSPVSVIQGPPGTGKSFTGARIVRSMHKAGLRILVLTYTNHALDQFMEDVLKAGVPESAMVRLGSMSKCTPRTEPLLLSKQRGRFRRSPAAWTVISGLKEDAARVGKQLQDAFNSVGTFSPTWDDIAEYLEFADGGHVFLDALRVPATTEGWARTGKKGQKVGTGYLYGRWIHGKHPGSFASELPDSARAVWAMPAHERRRTQQAWLRALLEEHLAAIPARSREFNEIKDKLDAQFGEADAQVVREKQIVGCTTTAAAKYGRLIRAAGADVVVVEEAGEILEGHVLAALSSSVRQLVLIGDHKQLRPKINNYALSVEKGDGFDLNCSLFERLVRQGMRHATLRRQHRMATAISVFARELTYPELLDGPGTGDRPAIRGLGDRVVFVNHTRPEDADRQLRDRGDPGLKESKRNPFEAHMVLRCVKYLGQQGYASDRIVVLTPYLGQLRVLRDLFRAHQHDPALSEMDTRDLIRAGLVSEAAAALDRKPLRISTIDNYQGEESDIVIVSLTRSNEAGDVGFMAAPERLNVLATRARDGMVLIGNMATFAGSKKGRAAWHPFFDLLRARGHLYDGLPVRCERHPERTAVLREPADFDRCCPDGGCTQPCNELLRCGIHKCRSRCHRVADHRQTACDERVDKVCERQHKTRVRCGREREACGECVQEDIDTERRARRDLQLEEERRRREARYALELQAVQDEIHRQRLLRKYEAEEAQREQTLAQHRAELAALQDAEAGRRRQSQRRAEAAAHVAEKAAAKNTEGAGGPEGAGGADWASGARAEWDFLKESEGAASKPLDELMEMVGLEEVKQEFLAVKSKVDTALRQGVSMADERFSCSMLGNPGTGKTTVARLYARFLTELCVIPGACFREKTGAALASLGVPGTKNEVEEILNEGGGVLFVDEAYQLTSGNNPGGGAVLDYLLAEVENLRGKVVFVLAGYSKQMESFFAHNPGLPSRFPVEMTFADYSDAELLAILQLKISRKYKGAMDCEDGPAGLYCRIVSRRIGRGRGKEGFGNARAVENAVDRISRRQADRLRRERKAGSKPNDLLFTREDLIGPEPGEALDRCEAWRELQGLIGLAAVKEAVRSLVSSIQQNFVRELAEQPPIEYSLNKVFLGNPGTGKTTVAKLYGQILVALGLLSKGEVVVKNPSDFVGAHLGQSEQQTKGILAATVGKVLVIDEAYGLYGGGGGGSGSSPGSSGDPYKTAVVDTIVAEVQSVPGDDRCVLLLGYKDQMETMFQNVNPGLSRRFPIASAFTFDDFSDAELRRILDLKVKKQGYQTTGQAASVAMEMLKRARNRPNFGNAGEIDIMLDAAKGRHQTRFARGQAKSAVTLEARDLDPDFDRAERAETNIRRLFEGTVGCEQVVALLEGYQETARAMKALQLDPRENIPFNFLFRGPPGTGKTTTAKKMGKVFYDMGFLASAEVVECSASELVGQFVGHTGPKVQQLFDRALGKVLFVDEAYRLGEGQFAREAMDEIVDLVTKDRYLKKLVIILAGYEGDINRLMSVNPGLTSRFPEVIDFRALTADECVALLRGLLQRQRKKVLGGKTVTEFDLSCLEAPSAPFQQALRQAFCSLAAQANWASARDVGAVARGVFKAVLRDTDGLASGRLVLAEGAVTDELDRMLAERASRTNSAKARPGLPLDVLRSVGQAIQEDQQQPAPAPAQGPPPVLSAGLETAATTTNPSEALQKTRDAAQAAPAPPDTPKPDPTTKPDPGPAHAVTRDAGVSDATWAQLERDKQAAAEREDAHRQLREAARRATDAAREAIVRRLLEEEAQRKKEEEARRRLKAMGRCPMGYEWIRQGGSGGWRCAGGSHFVRDGELGE